MAFVELRGARLFFTDEGGPGSPMLFVHGFSCDSHDWSWQLPAFERRHRVIAYDLRGHGRSSDPAEGYGILSLAADAIALVEHLECAPVTVLGHSLGGAVAASVGVERPDLVRGVVAIDPGFLLPDDQAPYLAAALRAYEEGDPGETAGRFFDNAGTHGPSTPRSLATWHNRRAAGVPEHVLRKTITGLIGGARPFALESSSAPYLGRLERPVLSFFVDPARAAVAERVFRHPGSATVCFEGSGHWLHQERPEEVNAIIEDWIAGIGG